MAFPLAFSPLRTGADNNSVNMNETLPAAKFWLVQRLDNILISNGMTQSLADLITFTCAVAAIVLLVWLINFLGGRLIANVISVIARKSATKWDDFMVKRRLFNKLVGLFSAMVVMASITTLFQGYSHTLIKANEIIVQVIIVWYVVAIINTMMDVINDVYESNPAGRSKSIKGYVQTAKIFVVVIGIILSVSVLFDKSPANILLGLGASAAVGTLIFKDTILGFIASIQISAQDMIRLGDWIEVPARAANGVVIEINVNNVKVRNWDNTISLIPIYSLVSAPFVNWRGMEESSGRRFTRPILIDVESVRVISKEEMETIAENKYVKPFADNMMRIFSSYNGSGIATNLGLYRAYLEASLKQNPLILEGAMVNHLPLGENGPSLQLYAFTKEKSWNPHEKIVSEITEHAVAMAPVFGLHLYQRPQSKAIEPMETAARSAWAPGANFAAGMAGGAGVAGITMAATKEVSSDKDKAAAVDLDDVDASGLEMG